MIWSTLPERIKLLARGRRVRRAFWALGSVFVLFNITVFLILPPIVRSTAERKASEALSRPVTIERVFINPYALSVGIHGLKVGERGGAGEFLSIRRIYANAQLASIWKGGAVLSAVHVDDPAVRIVRTGPAEFNFSDLLAPKPEPEPKGEPALFAISDIQVRGGNIAVVDETTGTSHRLDQISLSVPSVSNFPYFVETDVQPAFSARLDGSPVAMTGYTRPFADTLETALELELKGFDLTRYMRDVPVPVDFRLASGKLDLRLRFSYVQSRRARPGLGVSGDVAVTELHVNGKEGRPVLRLPELRIEGLAARPLAGQVRFGRIQVRAPELSVTRGRDGRINLLGLMPRAPAGRTAAPESPHPGALPPEEGKKAKTGNPLPLAMAVDRFELSGARVAIVDEAAGSGGTFRTVLAPIDLECSGLSTDEGRSGSYRFAMKTDSAEELTVVGSLSLNPLVARARVALDGVFLPRYAPYYLDAFRADVTDGRFSIGGEASFALEGDFPKADFRGRASLVKLAVADRAGGEAMVGLGELNVEGIAVKLSPPEPLSVGIEEIVLSKPAINAIVDKDGTLNIAAALVAKPAAAGTPEAKSPAKDPPPAPAPAPPPVERAPLPVVKVAKVTVREGSFEFADRSVSPSYKTSLDQIETSTQGFSLDPGRQEAPAEFSFRARLDKQSPLAVSGQICPNPERLLVNVIVDFQGVQLSPLTPYSGKYVGYPVEKGQLRLDLRYAIAGAKLTAQNRVLIDQLTLGDRVESPTATKLPVKFLIGLLKDRHGRIKLDVPVTGNLDDPKFRLMPIVLQTLVNLLERAVTSPFAFLTGSPEASYVEFDFGSAQLSPEATKKLDAIGQLLADRPALRFEVRTQTVAGPDTEALRRQFLNDLVKAQKRAETMGKKGQSVPLSEVQVKPEEYERFLRLAYEASAVPGKPRNFAGVARDVPVAEMEKLMLAGIPVTPDDLRRLAYRRAAKVREYLLASKVVDAVRLMLVEPEQIAAESGKVAVRPRANFELQLAEGGAPPGKQFVAPPDDGGKVRLPPSHKVRNTALGVGGGAAIIVGVLLLL
ncbi:MAG TPA: DUF748 domain-containing protein [Planctomycetota bacterium]|nr:DUF748 domain-containing protein [Planctomycetota bacterium]